MITSGVSNPLYHVSSPPKAVTMVRLKSSNVKSVWVGLALYPSMRYHPKYITLSPCQLFTV